MSEHDAIPASCSDQARRDAVRTAGLTVAPNAITAAMKVLLIMFSLLLCGASPAALAQSSGPVASGALNPGDVVRITVWRKPELSGDFVVAGDGSVSHPLYREVRVTGIPLAAVEARLREFLGKLETNPQFVVEPLLRVAVAGEVRQPSLYTLRPETSLGQAVAMAGGATDRGRTDRVLLVRDNKQVVVTLRAADQSGAAMPIRSGDQIVVERTSAVFRDYIAPIVSILGATAAIVSVVIYNR